MAVEQSGKKGRLVMWCPECGDKDASGTPEGMFFYTTEKNFTNRCPKCKEFIKKRKCTRCGHTWTPRDFDKLAAVCPKCSSPLWNRERVLPRRK